MELRVLPMPFSVCQVKDFSAVDWHTPFCFTACTDEECSLVCPTAAVPQETLKREDGWRAFRIEGVLDFSLIGILARISGILAERSIGIFVVSTYNTDYVLVKEQQLEKALEVLRKNGYTILT